MKSITCLVVLLACVATSSAQHPAVDFRFAPDRYYAAINLPDDWQKTLVDHDGALVYDFGPGPYATPFTEVNFGIAGEQLFTASQRMLDARIPIAQTELRGEGATVFIEAFSLPHDLAMEPPVFHPEVRRVGGLNGVYGWVHPAGEVDPAFRNVALGANRAVRYRVTVVAGSRKRVALGISEPYKPGPGTRVMELRVEGAPPLTVDPLAIGDRNEPLVFVFDAHDENGDGEIAVEVHASPQSPDPNVFLNVFWVFPEGADIDEQALAQGRLSDEAEIYYDAGPEHHRGQTRPRLDVHTATFTGEDLAPVIRIRSTARSFEFDAGTGALGEPGRPFLRSSPAPVSARQEENVWILELPRGTTAAALIVQHGTDIDVLHDWPDVDEGRERAIRYWMESADLPIGRILVPDPEIQYVLDASIRNMYQIRERVDGLPQFQPGPSVYRGLWVHDSVWFTDAALMLGDTAAARHVIDVISQYQKPDGRIEVMSPFEMWRETALFIFTVTRYAAMTNDRAWLAGTWPRIRSGMSWIIAQRARTLEDPSAPYYGLFPPGFTDGGIGGVRPEYSTVYWSLTAAKKAAEAAEWLGEDHNAREWRLFFDALMGSFISAARRDARYDEHGNVYVPMQVGDAASDLPPQRAQWAIAEAQNYGSVFPRGDTLVSGTFSMLNAGTVQGMPPNTGWLDDGIWGFFAPMQAMGQLAHGEREPAERLLYAYANHASPFATWVEEQMPEGAGSRTTGDVSNAAASSLFVGLVRKMLLMEHEGDLEILAGVPDHWFAPGSELILDDAPTEFGPVSLHLRVADDGRAGTLSVSLPSPSHERGTPRLFLAALNQKGFRFGDGGPVPEITTLEWGEASVLVFER